MKKRILAMLLALVMVFALVACGNDEPTPSKTPENPDNSETPVVSEEPEFDGVKEIVIGIGADIKTWEPWGGFNIARQNQAPLVYQNLTVDVVDLENKTMVHHFVLAESAEPLEDAVGYRIKIRAGIKDSAGYDFTAEDAIFSFEKCKEVSRLTQVNIIEKMELVDELTFDMYLAQDTVGTFYDVCNAINMVTKESYEASPDGMATMPVGTAPMVLDSYVANASVVFKKADSYWNEAANESKKLEDGYCSMWDLGDIDVIRYECITDSATMAIALETGEIDIARAIGNEDIALFESNDDFVLFSAPDAALGIAFNASEGAVTSNKNLRLALAYAMDAEACLIAAADGHGQVAKAWSYMTFVDYQDAWDKADYFEYNMETAKSYLAKWEQETGKKASDLSLRLMFQAEDAAEALGLAVQATIGELTGNPNTVTFEALDRSTFNTAKRSADAFEMYIVDSQLVTRSHSGFEWDSLVNEAKNGYNCFHVKDDVLQTKLMDAIQNTTTSDKTVSDFQDYVNEQCYMKNLCYVEAFGAAASWVGNLEDAIGAKNCLNLGALTYDWNASGK